MGKEGDDGGRRSRCDAVSSFVNFLTFFLNSDLVQMPALNSSNN